MDNIEDKILAINAMINKLSKKYLPKYIKESDWVSYNKSRYSIDEYLNASEARREVIEQDIERNYKRMPTVESLKKKRRDFIDNFNEASRDLGLGDVLNYHNAERFAEFLNVYEEHIQNMKFKDSGQLIQMFYTYRKTGRYKYKSIEDFILNYDESIPV